MINSLSDPHVTPPPSQSVVDALATLTEKSFFYFIRHGQSIANGKGIIQGHSESPLSPRGRRQAASAGKWFKRQNIDALFTSPLGRATETARIIAHRCGAQPIVHDAVCEIDTGVFSNRTWQEVEREYPAECHRFRVESWEAVPKAERVSALIARARSYWEHLLAVANGGARRIVTVTHGGMLQWLIKATMGSVTWMPLVPAANCAVFLFYARPEAYDASRKPEARPRLTTAQNGAADKAAVVAAARGDVAEMPTTLARESTPSANIVRGAYSAWQMMNYVPY